MIEKKQTNKQNKTVNGAGTFPWLYLIKSIKFRVHWTTQSVWRLKYLRRKYTGKVLAVCSPVLKIISNC